MSAVRPRGQALRDSSGGLREMTQEVLPGDHSSGLAVDMHEQRVGRP